MKKLTLEEFPIASYEDWKKLALKELRDQPFESLIWKNENGFNLEPYYSSSSKQTQQLRAKNDVWQICQTIKEKEIKAANKAALEVLNGGASAVRFQLNITSKNDLTVLLNEIGIQYIATHFVVRSNQEALSLLQWLVSYCNERSIDTKSLLGSVQRDVIDALSEDELWKEIVTYASNHFRSFKVFAINATSIHNSGGNATQDIAYALAVGNEFLHKAVEAGFSVEQTNDLLQLNFATDGSYFVEIAKYRVFRNLWNTILHQYDSTQSFTPPFVHAETSTFLQTTRDAYNNLLRATTQAMSAAIGMADSIEVICHDDSYATPTEASLRLARNVQHLLVEESYLNGTEDFAAGSHFQEAVAKELAASSWNLFLEIEKRGGVNAATDYLNSLVQQSLELKKQDVKDGKRIVVGVNKYINKSEADIVGSANRLT